MDDYHKWVMAFPQECRINPIVHAHARKSDMTPESLIECIKDLCNEQSRIMDLLLRHTELHFSPILVKDDV